MSDEGDRRGSASTSTEGKKGKREKTRGRPLDEGEDSCTPSLSRGRKKRNPSAEKKGHEMFGLREGKRKGEKRGPRRAGTTKRKKSWIVLTI